MAELSKRDREALRLLEQATKEYADNAVICDVAELARGQSDASSADSELPHDLSFPLGVSLKTG